MKKFSLLFIVFAFSFQSIAQEIKWLSFEEAISKNKENPKQILIDVYTDWCGYCKKMDRDTYENLEIISLINQNYYPVKLDAEQKETITYNGKEFKYVAQGRKGYHEFAAALLQGNMSYPNTVFLDKNEQLIEKIPGYLTPQIIEPILVYLGEEKYLEEPWDEFQKNFISNL